MDTGLFFFYPLLACYDYTFLADMMRKPSCQKYLGFWNDPHGIRRRMSNLFLVYLSVNMSCVLDCPTVSTLLALPFELWGSGLTSTHPSIQSCPWA